MNPDPGSVRKNYAIGIVGILNHLWHPESESRNFVKESQNRFAERDNHFFAERACVGDFAFFESVPSDFFSVLISSV